MNAASDADFDPRDSYSALDWADLRYITSEGKAELIAGGLTPPTAKVLQRLGYTQPGGLWYLKDQLPDVCSCLPPIQAALLRTMVGKSVAPKPPGQPTTDGKSSCPAPDTPKRQAMDSKSSGPTSLPVVPPIMASKQPIMGSNLLSMRSPSPGSDCPKQPFTNSRYTRRPPSPPQQPAMPPPPPKPPATPPPPPPKPPASPPPPPPKPAATDTRSFAPPPPLPKLSALDNGSSSRAPSCANPATDAHPAGQAEPKPTQPPRHYKLIPGEAFEAVKDKELNPDSNERVDSKLKQLFEDCGGIGGLVAILSSTDPAAATQAAWALRCLVFCEYDKKGERAAKAVAEGAIARLVALLTSGCEGAQYQSTVALWNLAEVSSEMAESVAAAGACAPLVALLSGGAAQTQKGAVGALLYLASSSDQIAGRVAAGGAIPPLVALLSSSFETARANALHVLLYLAGAKAHDRTYALPGDAAYKKRKTKIAAAGAIKPVVALLSSGSARSRERAARMLESLACHNNECKTEMVAAGAVAPLVALLSSGSAGSREQAVKVIERLAWHNEHIKAEIATKGAIAPLVALLSSGSAGAQEQAAKALQRLAKHSEDRRASIAAAGGVAPLVALLSTGSAGAQEAAVKGLADLAIGSEQRREQIASAGAIKPLVALLSSGSVGVQDEAAEALKRLAQGSQKRKADIAVAGGLKTQEEIRGRSTDEQVDDRQRELSP